jgi:hypothetical protein
MKLPNGDQAVIHDEKLVGYCLSPDHPRGRHKARLFAAALGFTQANAGLLKQALLNAARDTGAIATRSSEFGDMHEIEFDCVGPRGIARVLSVWIIRPGDTVPILVTCYPH